MQAQAKAHDVLRKTRAVVTALDRQVADVASVANTASSDTDSMQQRRMAGTVADLKSKVSQIDSCLEVCLFMCTPE